MKIIKFNNFIKENASETPEEYIKIALMKLKKKIESFFEKEEEETSLVKSPQKITMGEAKKKGREKESEEGKMSFKDLNLSLDSSEFSKYSSTFDNIKFVFSDDTNMYHLYITIPLEEGVPKDDTKDFADTDIKKCYIKFKKYDLEGFNLDGQISKTVDIDKVNQEFLVTLKIELDEEFGDDEEKLEIET